MAEESAAICRDRTSQIETPFIFTLYYLQSLPSLAIISQIIIAVFHRIPLPFVSA
jgi:hypothetical protein